MYDPHVAAPTLLLIDAICSLPFALHAMPHCDWHEVTPVSIGGALALPFGVLVRRISAIENGVVLCRIRQVRSDKIDVLLQPTL